MCTRQSLNTLSPDATIAQITSAGKNIADLLACIGFSSAGHEDETLRSVCQQLKWSEVEVMKWLRKHDRRNTSSIEAEPNEVVDFGDDIARWCSHTEVHFMDKSNALFKEVKDEFSRVYQVHGTQYPWLKNIKGPLEMLAEKLRYAYHFRRNTLFPLFRGLRAENELMQGTVRKVEDGLQILRDDHIKIAELIKLIEKKGFREMDDACSTLHIFSRNLQTLFVLLIKQIDLEREHIMPLAISILES